MENYELLNIFSFFFFETFFKRFFLTFGGNVFSWLLVNEQFNKCLLVGVN